MKQLELNLQKRLLIVEIPENYNYNTYADKMTICNELNKTIICFEGKWSFLCKGPDLTEEIAEDLVHGFDLGYFVDYNHHNPRSYKLTAIESFISSIEANGFFWGKWNGQNETFEEAESRTFNIDNVIIFEIL